MALFLYLLIASGFVSSVCASAGAIRGDKWPTVIFIAGAFATLAGACLFIANLRII